MAKRWKIDFVDLNGAAYTVNIYDNDYTDSSVTSLRGADNVLSIEEDNSDDVLLPVRTSSGNLRIVSDRDTWLQVITHGSMVELMQGNACKWRGYITKSAYNGDVFQTVTTYDIPVHCILSHLETAFFVVSPYNSPTFATLLTEAFQKCGAYLPTTFIWPLVLGRYPQFLETRFQRSNYYADDNETLNGDTICSATYLEVISQMCTYFGITLCADGESLLFLTPEENNALFKGNTSELEDVETDGKEAIVTARPIRPAEDALEDYDYMSANNQEGILPPFKSIKITGSFNAYDNFDAQYPKEVVDDWINNHFTRIEHVDSSQYRLWRRIFAMPTPIEDPSISYSGVAEYELLSDKVVDLRFYEYQDSQHAGFLTSRDFCEKTPSVLNAKVDYDWRNMLTVTMVNAMRNCPVFAIIGKRDVSLSHNAGAINLYYKVSKDASGLYDGGVTGNDWYWELRIGDYYWNGNSWQTQPTTFAVGWKLPPIGQPIVECESNRTLGDGYDGMKGLIIPLTDDMHGKVSLRLFYEDRAGVTENVYFEDIQLSYVRKNRTPGGKPIEEESELTISEVLSNKDIEEYTQSCEFSSFAGVNGYGIALNHDFTPVRDLPYGDEQRVVPEQRRLDLVKALRSSPASLLDIEIKNTNTLKNRYEHVAEGELFPGYLPLSVGDEWRDGKRKVKLIKYT